MSLTRFNPKCDKKTDFLILKPVSSVGVFSELYIVNRLKDIKEQQVDIIFFRVEMSTVLIKYNQLCNKT